MRAAKSNCSQYSKSIEDLPDHVVVEILCRLPCKSAVQCKYVSKHWNGLISDPHFIRRFLCLQSHKQKPIIRTLVLSEAPTENKFLSMSSCPESEIDNFPADFSFLPCFQSPNIIKDNEPVVLGAYNDLVLCCATEYFQRDYYICNPCTKKWVRLPPTPGFQKVRVGFICEPFYNEAAGEKEEERNLELDFEYTYMVVRIICVYPEDLPTHQYRLEVFCSESRRGRWLVSTVYSPQSFNFDTLVNNIGLAHNGKLYWWSLAGFLIGVDLYSNINNCVFFCSYIDKPQAQDDQIGGGFKFLGVYRGRMRLCQLVSFGLHFYGIIEIFLRIWEFREDQVDKWCLIDTLPIEQMIWENPSTSDWEVISPNDLIAEMTVLAFDPNNEDILFLQVRQHIIMCNIRAKTVTTTKSTARYKSNFCFVRSVFSFVLPWWPTPVPKLHQPGFDNPFF